MVRARHGAPRPCERYARRECAARAVRAVDMLYAVFRDALFAAYGSAACLRDTTFRAKMPRRAADAASYALLTPHEAAFFRCLFIDTAGAFADYLCAIAYVDTIRCCQVLITLFSLIVDALCYAVPECF